MRLVSIVFPHTKFVAFIAGHAYVEIIHLMHQFVSRQENYIDLRTILHTLFTIFFKKSDHFLKDGFNFNVCQKG